MKKLFALILVICVITLTFASCDIASLVNKVITTEEPTDDPTLPKTYTYGVMNITLPAGFKEVKEGVFKNDEVSVRCVRMLFSSITPVGDNPFPTLEVFMKNCPSLREDPDKVFVKEENGIKYIDFETTSSNVASVFKAEKDGDMQCIMGFETGNAFYIVSFYSPSLDYETVKTQAFEWAKTINFES